MALEDANRLWTARVPLKTDTGSIKQARHADRHGTGVNY
jgi:hypothetical protein